MELEHNFRPGRSRSETASNTSEGVKPIESEMPHQRDVSIWSSVDQCLRTRRLGR